MDPPIQRTLMLATAIPRLLSPAANAVLREIREEMRELDRKPKRATRS